MWGLSALDGSIAAPGSPGGFGCVRAGADSAIYANTGIVAAGKTARICYSVENAKSVRFSPCCRKCILFPTIVWKSSRNTPPTTHCWRKGYDGRGSHEVVHAPGGGRGIRAAADGQLRFAVELVAPARRLLPPPSPAIYGHKGSDRTSRQACSATGRAPRFRPQSRNAGCKWQRYG